MVNLEHQTELYMNYP